MAFCDAPDSEPSTSEDAVMVDGEGGVFGAGWLETAGGWRSRKGV